MGLDRRWTFLFGHFCLFQLAVMHVECLVGRFSLVGIDHKVAARAAQPIHANEIVEFFPLDHSAGRVSREDRGVCDRGHMRLP